MEAITRYLWIFTYAIGDLEYICPFYFENQQIAEGRINHILSYAKHIRKISLEEKKQGYKFGERHLPYIQENRRSTMRPPR